VIINIEVVLMRVKVLAIIQARMTSTRLPGKVLMELCGEPILYHIVHRAARVENIDTLVIATSSNQTDDPIAVFAESQGIRCFRGDEKDVLSRFYYAATELSAETNDVIIRLTADNPFMDPEVLEKLLIYFDSNHFAYATTSQYPLGVGAEVFTFRALTDAYRNATKLYEREHVTPFMFQDLKTFGKLISPVDWSHLRLTVDTPEDYKVAQQIYNLLYPENHEFLLKDIISLLKENPDIAEINKNVHQKQLGE